VQGFVAPGHVCTVVGCTDYEELVKEFHVPIVVGGFEPVDLLQALSVLVTFLEEGRAEFANEYPRSVSYHGNVEAQKILAEVFEVADQPWRGLGEIPLSGFRLRDKFAAFDADKVFALNIPESDAPAVCISAEILKGLKRPTDCPAFGVACTPENPLGAPMVSSEGACSAYYQYRRHSLVTIQ
jgi:hydrogenase expression/formation protein HypD